MVASCKALPACADVRIAIILSQFEGLVHVAVSVAQIRRLWVAEMGSEALDPTASKRLRVGTHT